MKKSFYFFCMSLIVFALDSCGSKSNTENKDEEEEAFELQKGDIRVVLELSEPDILAILADNNKQDIAFQKALEEAYFESDGKGVNYVDLFAEKWNIISGGRPLSAIFSNRAMRDKVNLRSSDKDIIGVLKKEVNSAIDNAENVVRHRLNNLELDFNIRRLEGHKSRIMIELSRPKDGDISRVLKLLASSGNIEFWETYNGNEVYYALQSIINDYMTTLTTENSSNEMIVNDTTFESDLAAKIINKEEEASNQNHPLLIPYNSTIAVVGLASVHDTASVNRMIRSDVAQQILRNLPDGEARLVWGAKPAEAERYNGLKGTYFELYALKVTDPSGRAPLEGDVITSAKDGFDNSKPIVSMQMNTEGTRIWAELTKKNLKRCIAVVLDDVVYTAPTIQSEITGGQSQISGNFTIEDTEDLANVLNSGKLPVPVRIISYEIVGE